MRPPKITSDPVNVTLSLYVLQLRSVEEAKMAYTLDLVIRNAWLDPRFKFPDEIKDEKIVLDPSWRESIWTPDVLVKNALDTKLHSWVVPSLYYWLFRNLTVYFSARLTVDLSCDMHLQSFPHDTQECSIQVMGLMNPSRDMRLTWREVEPIRLSKLMNLPQYDLLTDSDHLSRCDTLIDGEDFSCLEAAFHMRRRGGYFVINTYIPTVLIVLMSMLTFWMPPDAVPARITLGVTSLLTIITKQYSSKMPSVSYIIALNVWLSVCVGFVFCSLLEYAIVITLVNKKNNVVNSHNSTDSDDQGKTPLRAAWEKTQACCLMLSGHTVDMICRIAFPLSFFVFCLIYWACYAAPMC